MGCMVILAGAVIGAILGGWIGWAIDNRGESVTPVATLLLFAVGMAAGALVGGMAYSNSKDDF